MQALEKRFGDKTFFGYMAVGFLSLFVGIAIFMLFVIPDRRPESGVPRDVQVLFTNVYMNQLNIKRELGHYTPALIQIDVDQDTCRSFSCLLTVAPDGQDFEFRAAKGGQIWSIHSKSPVPKEVSK